MDNLRLFEFPESTMRLIWKCISYFTFSMLWNCKRTAEFKPAWGSPWNEFPCLSNGWWVKVDGRHSLSAVTILLYLIFFCRWSFIFCQGKPKVDHVVKDVVEGFCHAAGQWISVEKFIAFASPRVPYLVCQEITRIRGIRLRTTWGNI